MRQVPKLNKLLKLCVPTHKNIFIIYSVLLLTEIAASTVQPLFTYIFFSKHITIFAHDVSSSKMNFLFANFMAAIQIAIVLCNPIAGIFADILGRKPTILFSIAIMFLMAVTSIYAIASNHLILIPVVLLIYSLLFSIKIPSIAAITDSTKYATHKIKRVAFVQFFIGIAFCIGPVIGGILAATTLFELPYLPSFIFIAVLAVVGFIYVFFKFKETLVQNQIARQSKSQDKPFVRNIMKLKLQWQTLKQFFAKKELLIIMLILILGQINWGTYYQFMPAVMKQTLHYSNTMIGSFVGVIGLSLVISTGIFLPILQARFSIKNLILFSILSQILGAALTLISILYSQYHLSQILLWIGIFPVVMGDVILFCIIVSLCSDMMNNKHQGIMIGMIYVLCNLTWALSDIAGSLLMAIKAYLILLLCPISLIILIIVYSCTSKVFNNRLET